MRAHQQAVNAVIDPYPADNGAYRTQWDWTNFLNRLERPMISAADVYRAGKSASDEVLDSLRKDIDFANFFGLVTSTNILYSGNNLYGIITQNYRSNVVKPSRSGKLVIPVYNGTPLVQALMTEEGINYLQALFATGDDPRVISGTLEHLLGNWDRYIRLYTPARPSIPNRGPIIIQFSRPVKFRGKYIIDGGSPYPEGFYGVSRGLSASPRGRRARK